MSEATDATPTTKKRFVWCQQSNTYNDPDHTVNNLMVLAENACSDDDFEGAMHYFDEAHRMLQYLDPESSVAECFIKHNKITGRALSFILSYADKRNIVVPVDKYFLRLSGNAIFNDDILLWSILTSYMKEHSMKPTVEQSMTTVLDAMDKLPYHKVIEVCKRLRNFK